MTDAEAFDVFWKAYPRKVAKGDARKAWLQTAKIRPVISELISAIERAKKCDQWQKDGGQFIPHASTYLRQERWEDEYEITLEDPKQWYETSAGIEAKGRELGIIQSSFPHFPAFKSAVMAAANGKVVNIRG